MAYADDVKQTAEFYQKVTTAFMHAVSDSKTQRVPLAASSGTDGFVYEYVILGRITNPETGKTAVFVSHGTTWAVACEAIKVRCREVLMAFPELGDGVCVMHTSAIAGISRQTTEAQLIQFMEDQEGTAHSKRRRESVRPLDDDALTNAVEKLN